MNKKIFFIAGALLLVALGIYFGISNTASIFPGTGLGEHQSSSSVQQSEDSGNMIYTVGWTFDQSDPQHGAGSGNINLDFPVMDIRSDVQINSLTLPDSVSIPQTQTTANVQIKGIYPIYAKSGDIRYAGQTLRYHFENASATCQLDTRDQIHPVISCDVRVKGILDEEPVTSLVWTGDMEGTLIIKFPKSSTQQQNPIQENPQQNNPPQNPSQENLPQINASQKPSGLSGWFSNLWNIIIGWFQK